jgi:hypothetical protein
VQASVRLRAPGWSARGKDNHLPVGFLTLGLTALARCRDRVVDDLALERRHRLEPARDAGPADVKALEAFGDLRREEGSCVLPADYLLAVGFKTVRPHHHFPGLRLELKSTVSWREDVEVALERLLGSMTPERALRMA